MMRRAILVLPLALVAAACAGGNDDPDGASSLWAKIHTTDYHQFARAPGYPGKVASNGPHGDQVEIFVNPTLQAAIDAKMPLTAWPDGSLIVKDGFKSGTFKLVAVMEKRAGAWYFAEYEADGTVDYSGSPSLCVNCHSAGSDFVRAFSFPK
ncbi:hypothetical protein BH09MYX1_BH09MYX1_64840 [soil metagenome]